MGQTDSLDIPAGVLDDELEPATLEGVLGAMVTHADAIRMTLSDIALLPLHEATLLQRSQLAQLHEEIDRVRRDASTWADAILLAFRHAAEKLGGATEIPMQGGVVRIEQPRPEYRVDVAGLRHELRELMAHGLITEDEIDSIFEVVVAEKANNTKLNALAKHRGAEVASAIDRHRQRVPGNPMSAKVRFTFGD